MSLFEVKQTNNSNLLVDRFIVPPFSILDTKQGYWQDRKRYWLNMGIKSEIGRGDKLTFHIESFQYGKGEGKEKPASRTSIFDPVVCEISYKWYSRENDKILDPFAGGSVRGIVCGALNRNYTGIDLSDKQIKANLEQYEDISKKHHVNKPTYICGNSENVKELTNNQKYNMIFSCPPYYNLEVYSDNESDLSNKSTYDEFLVGYRNIIKNSCDLLEDDSFAVFVVGNVRDSKTGGYYDLAGDTVKAFQDAGLLYYNDAILVNVIGTLPVRTPKQFNCSRKMGKQHQSYLVFYKGNPDNINKKFGNFEGGNEDD